MAPPVDLVHVVRNGLVESIHTGDVAVCDVDGRVVAFAGDPERALFGRSCEKPVQGAVSFHAMDEPGDLPDDLIAVMCASHNGEPRHVAAVRRLLRRGPVPVSALQNPRDRMRGGTRSRIHDNCSGKHAGMLVASAHRGWDLATYRSRAHPIQRRVSRAMIDATGVARPTFGVDGCGLPVHGVTLRAMATMYARLSAPDRAGRLASSVDRVVRAMTGSPFMVGGTRRLDTDVMTAAAGRVLAKEGAEALVCATSLDQGLGIAVKVTDGSWRRIAPAFVKVLRDLDVHLDGDGLRRHEEMVVLGGDEPVGTVEAVVALRHRAP
ncbi:MAG TPA: asparaginase [Actinomycetota bacterium]|nr:asparaginase [Actinomycetota bacterium]